jgi:recombinational DNA repair protein (RecF pathway)
MTIEKTTAYVLKTLPYRESSGIFHLMTENHGLIHGIAKVFARKRQALLF